MVTETNLLPLVSHMGQFFPPQSGPATNQWERFSGEAEIRDGLTFQEAPSLHAKEAAARLWCGACIVTPGPLTIPTYKTTWGGGAFAP